MSTLNEILSFYFKNLMMINLILLVFFGLFSLRFRNGQFKIFKQLNYFKFLTEEEKKEFDFQILFAWFPIFNVFYVSYQIYFVFSFKNKEFIRKYNELYICEKESIYYRKYETIKTLDINEKHICPYCKSNDCTKVVTDDFINNATIKHSPKLNIKELEKYFLEKENEIQLKKESKEEEKILDLNREQLEKLNNFKERERNNL